MWDDWTSWSACSATCGNGTKMRDRQILTAPRGLGKLCEPKDRSEVAGCKDQECGTECVDGEWSEWSGWSECSASCGEGYEFRHRRALVTPNSCGKALEGTERDYRSCNVAACTDQIDCVSSSTGWQSFEVTRG